eukprot:2665173-Pyramimonas_sp.AAC.1
MHAAEAALAEATTAAHATAAGQTVLAALAQQVRVGARVARVRRIRVTLKNPPDLDPPWTPPGTPPGPSPGSLSFARVLRGAG